MQPTTTTAVVGVSSDDIESQVSTASKVWVDTPSEVNTNDGDHLCIVCYEKAKGTPLRPCGHDSFCSHCALKLQTCPLCRVPLTPLPGQPAMNAFSDVLNDRSSVSISGSIVAPTETASPEQAAERPVKLLSQHETFVVVIIAFSVGVFMWLGSYQEWKQGIDYSYDSSLCEESTSQGHVEGCAKCKEGLINVGAKCFSRLEDVPPMKIGNVFGRIFFFRMIVATQICAAFFNVFLIQRLCRRKMLPGKHLVILVMVLLVAVARMVAMDTLMLPNYFDGETYHIFHEPAPCDSDDAWLGSDGVRYCNQSASNTSLYYIATHHDAYTDDVTKCSSFAADSPLLDYGRTSEDFEYQFWEGKGHARFSRLGWVLGGEFAFYLFFAVAISGVANGLFVAGTTLGKESGVIQIVLMLEVIQIGTLCPAAIFTHGSCLQYTDPLGTPFEWIRYVAVRYGYCIAGVAFVSIMLAATWSILTVAIKSLDVLGWNPPDFANARSILTFARPCLQCVVNRLLELLWFCYGVWLGIAYYSFLGALCLLSVVGLFLGCLAVVGQLCKQGPWEAFKAIALVSDLLFKAFAIACLKPTLD